ncbi:MAG: hypothetical protein K1X89_01550 [Myxococcaceae bacterium]|nr:hypothetical protein [Myxococcaceae bacterium]
MRTGLRLLPLAALLAFSAGCESVSNKCARITCDQGYVCEQATGVCRRTDAGTPTTDAGQQDAGPISDGGSDCSPACGSGQVCDPVSLRCVQCVSNADCACPLPICNGATQSCIAAPADAGTPAVPGDTCGEATPLVFPACGTHVSTTVDLGTFSDDEDGTCAAPGAFGKDAVYTLRLDAPHDVLVTAQALASGVEPLVYLRRSPCESGEELACKQQLGAPTTLRLKSLPKGDYALVLDSYSAASSGPITLSVDLSPPTGPANETCATAAELPLDGGVVALDTSLGEDDVDLVCNDKRGSADLVYRLEVAEESNLTVVARAPDGGPDSVLGLFEGPCANAASLDAGVVTCADATPPAPDVLRRRALAPGTYFLVVEPYGPSSAGVVNLSASVSASTPVPPNDTCAAPQKITFPAGQNSVTFVSDPGLGNDDTTASCSSSRGGPELVYRLDWPTTQAITVTTKQVAGGYADPLVYLREDSCDSGAELACVDEISPTPEVLTQTLSAGTYYLFIEGYGASGAGPTEVTVTRGP